MFFMLKKQFFHRLALLTMFVGLLCGALTTSGKNVEITILATADIHGQIALVQGSVAPLVADYRKRLPDSVIYVDVGDTAQGTFAINRRRGKGMMSAMGNAGCDIWVPGNHEMEYGFEAFKAMVAEFPGTVLAANLSAPELSSKVRDLVIVEKQGVKIAFIGLMLKNMNNCFPVAEARFQTLPGAAVLQKCVRRAIAQGADITVLLRHAGKYGGGENLMDILRHTPEVQLVIGAHTHLPEPGCRIANAWYVQPAAHGRNIAVVKIFFDPASRQIVQLESKLQKLAPKRTNPGAEARKKAPAVTANDENFVAVKLREACKSDLALYAVSSVAPYRKLLNKKSPLVIDYYRAFSYLDPVITVDVSAGEFRAIMREYVRFAHKRKQLLAVAGFSFTARKGKLHDLEFEVKKSRYTLAITAFAAAGAGGQLPGIRRILQKRIDHAAAEKAPALLEILCKNQLSKQ